MYARTNNLKISATWLMSLALTFFLLASDVTAAPKKSEQPPNILFIILDDVGIDQMRAFGYGDDDQPRLPNIDAIADAGIKFRNFWAMPECSPARALLFVGRYPPRTNVTNAILSVDLANSQVAPYETTTPRILRHRNYESGLFGKFHLSGSDANSDNNPLGFTAVSQLGWDYFAGWQDGAPHPIDETAGGVSPAGDYSCGFIPNSDTVGGYDQGACYFPNDNDNDTDTCQEMTRMTDSSPGRTCMEDGGIFNPDTSCEMRTPRTIDFTLQNGYYAGQLVFNEPDGSFHVINPHFPSAIAGHGQQSPEVAGVARSGDDHAGTA